MTGLPRQDVFTELEPGGGVPLWIESESWQTLVNADPHPRLAGGWDGWGSVLLF